MKNATFYNVVKGEITWQIRKLNIN
jgi:hypothetical protein